MMPEREEDVFIFSWLSTCRADWTGPAIVYKFFWSDPSLWTYLSWPWPLGPLSYRLEAAVHTVCHVQIIKPLNPIYQCFSPLGLLSVSVCLSVSGWLFPCLLLVGPVCRFLCIRLCSSELSGVCTSNPVLLYFSQKNLKSYFSEACRCFCVKAG